MKTFYDLKTAYRKALKNNQDTFEIDGYQFVTGFARYLIDYFDMIGVPQDKPLSSFINKAETDS